MATIEIAPGWIDAVQRYVEGLMVHSVIAAQQATEVFRDKVIEQARSDPDWSSMADNIEVWSQDGQMIIGVQDQNFVSQATLLEYGDMETPPNPLFRRLTSATYDGNRAAQDYMDSKYGKRMSSGITPVKGMKS